MMVQEEGGGMEVEELGLEEEQGGRVDEGMEDQEEQGQPQEEGEGVWQSNRHGCSFVRS